MDDKIENFSFIDCHLHFHSPAMTTQTIIDIIQAEFPHITNFYESPDDNSMVVGLMDAINCEAGWVINYESLRLGYSIETNDWVAKFCEDSNNRLKPIGGINPSKHEDAANIMREYLETERIRGVKIHGPHQLVYPNAYTEGLQAQKELYELCEELKVPIMFHTGSSVFPQARSKYGNPLCLEDILIDFPALTIIMSHGGRPFWMREAEYLMLKFDKLYLDIAGVPPSLLPKYFPRFHRYAERTIFGSDYPSPGVPSPRENADAIAKLPLSKDVLQKIFRDNARKIIK